MASEHSGEMRTNLWGGPEARRCSGTVLGGAAVRAGCAGARSSARCAACAGELGEGEDQVAPSRTTADDEAAAHPRLLLAGLSVALSCALRKTETRSHGCTRGSEGWWPRSASCSSSRRARGRTRYSNKERGQKERCRRCPCTFCVCVLERARQRFPRRCCTACESSPAAVEERRESSRRVGIGLGWVGHGGRLGSAAAGCGRARWLLCGE